jgi:hypothetical protein
VSVRSYTIIEPIDYEDDHTDLSNELPSPDDNNMNGDAYDPDEENGDEEIELRSQSSSRAGSSTYGISTMTASQPASGAGSDDVQEEITL